MSKPLRVLILEDNPSDAELMVRELRKAGFDPTWKRVETECDFLAALDPAPEIILADYRLPQFNGITALDLIQERKLDIPFILLSGSIGDELAVEAIKKGAADYLLKDRMARLGPAVVHTLEEKIVRLERDRAEDEVRDNDLRFRALIENSTDGITLLDAQGKAIYDSPAAAGMLGYAPEDWIGKQVFELVHPDDLPAIQELFQKLAVSPGALLERTFRVRHKTGSWLWIEAVARNLLAEPAVKAIVINYRDITERKRYEAESQALLEMMLGGTATNSLPEFLELIRKSIAKVIFAENFFVVFHNKITGLFEEVFAVDKYDAPMPPSRLEKSITAYVYRTGQPLMLTQAMFEELVAQGQVELVGARPTSWLGAPLKTPNETIGVIAVQNYNDPNCYTQRDMEFIASVGAEVALAIEHKRSEEALQESEQQFRTLFEQAAVGVAVLETKTGRFVRINKKYCDFIGYTVEEMLHKTYQDVTYPEDVEANLKQTTSLLAGEIDEFTLEKRFIGKDGRLLWGKLTVSPLWKPGTQPDTHLDIAVVEDITERKRAEEALIDSENRFRALVENSTDAITLIDADGNTLYRSPAAYRIVGQKPATTRETSIFEGAHPDDLQAATKDFASLLGAPDKRVSFQFRALHSDGSWRWLEGTANNLLADPSVRAIVANYRDVTERKITEEALTTSEAKLRALFEGMRDNVLVIDREGMYRDIAPTSPENLLITPSELLGKKLEEVLPPNLVKSFHDTINKVLDTKQNVRMEYQLNFDGRSASYEASISMLDADSTLWVARDITERKHAEQEIISLAKFPSENASPVLRINQDGLIMYANKASAPFLTLWECEAGDAVPKYWQSLVTQALTSMKSDLVETEYQGRTYSILVTPVAGSGYVNLYGRDITNNKKAEARVQRQLEHLTALSEVDKVIASNFDLLVSLTELLTQVTKELGVDAADILILNAGMQTLEYAAERGFRTKAIRKAQVRLGANYAGAIAIDRQTLHIPDLRNEPDNLLLTTQLKGEDFVSYYGVPLIAKGQVNGVLEVFHREALEPDAEWIDFLNALAGQAAIAIENSTLFENFQRSNLELQLAYDATIEGWSHALDLRDKETEGHTQRVTEMTVKLARTFDLGEPELMQVRWGALLHDIGKMGVPDAILLKPGPLTDEEWIIMKKHPDFANEMLSPILYLRRALDIPYCHHEKWDGSGYPRGLKGEQIPLVARIFAVVDVWDALMSDRPYRKAWTKEKAHEHILSSSGTHFDPQVVDAFLQLAN